VTKSNVRRVAQPPPAQPASSDLALQTEANPVLAGTLSRTDTQTLSDLGSTTGEFAPTTVQATGQGWGTTIQRIQDLTGADLEAKLQNASVGNIISFPAGAQEFSNFDTIFNGVRVGAGTTRRGIIGTGPGSTIFRMTALTSTRSGEVPTGAGTTNQLYLMYAEQDGLRLAGFTLEGTDQNHLYGGLRLHGVNGGLVEQVDIDHIPGDFYIPPGETFGVAGYLCSNMTYRDIVCDGTDGGTGWPGASALGENNFTNVRYERCRAQGWFHSALIAMWEGIGTCWLIDCDSHQNRTAFNIEKVGREVELGAGNEATIHIVNPKFGRLENFGQDVFLGNHDGSADIHIYDPTWYTSGQGRDGASGHGSVGEIRIWFPATHFGGPNLQQQSDVHVWTGGSWSGKPGYGGVYSGGTDNAASIINWSPF
jgi:hypothetical protein